MLINFIVMMQLPIPKSRKDAAKTNSVFESLLTNVSISKSFCVTYAKAIIEENRSNAIVVFFILVFSVFNFMF
jgi:hypothetical protein